MLGRIQKKALEEIDFALMHFFARAPNVQLQFFFEKLGFLPYYKKLRRLEHFGTFFLNSTKGEVNVFH